ncbi:MULTISPECIES: GNAT family N-acetyltransferase [Bacillus]|uniref:GNAT family N-acetyltransferase n=1 Tax=Bacillus TaxID=1386 RepID=UPI00159FC7CC|nr:MULTISPECIES: GNAT family N-acetyltransferase [Bacillus]MCY7467812.1 GNAT family N-acetyltransferase [Bacillus safensis]NWF42229.1 spermidine acetyltransferase [Bacillus sp. 8A6]USY28344.1 GNAT family N-acetyltransferase [Bacillus safensis]GLF83210.1 spermine/spermidine acetyltransferase [Bacillus safensis]
MNIEIKPVTDHNRAAVLDLKVSGQQKSYVESSKVCLEDAVKCEYYQPAALYYQGDLIGFAMYGLFPGDSKTNEDGRVWLDRFFIDERFQGRGLGKKMLDALIRHLTIIYKCNKIYLSIYEENKPAKNLYLKFGFQFNGELDFNGEKVMVKKI